MDTAHLAVLKKIPWIDNIGQPGDDPTSGPVSVSESMHGYFLSNAGDRPKKKREDHNCVSLCPLSDETKTDPLIERRSVLEYVQFGHTTWQHYQLQLTLTCGGKLTSQGYYRYHGRKPNQKQIDELLTNHASEDNVWELVLVKCLTSVSMYACRK